MSPFPPGVSFIVANLPTILSPSILVYLIFKVLDRLCGIAVPPWILVSACVAAFPFTLFLRVTWRDWKDARDAAATGAVLPPCVRDWTPGSILTFINSMDNLRRGYPGANFKEAAMKYGNTFNFRLFFENRYFTMEPEHIKAMLATQFDNFEKGAGFKESMRPLLGTGVFNSDGESWKFHRAMTRPFFSKERISDFDIFERHALEALNHLKTRLSEGYPVDIQDLASCFTMDCATEFLFSHDVHSLGAGLPYPHYSPKAATNDIDHPVRRFARAFDETQRLLSTRGRAGKLWPLFEFFRDKLEDHLVVVKGFIEPIIGDALKKKRERIQVYGEEAVKGDREVSEGESLLDHLVNFTDDETTLRDETLNILFAGRDTTTNSITFVTYVLAENPHVFHRLREEVLEMVGQRRPTYEDMRNMKYLRAVINETIRLYPAVPFNIRGTNKPVLLPNKDGAPPFYIPANSRMPYSVFWMHRRQDLWGPDAEVFDPDRFLDERVKKYITPNPFIFLPFNAGPRICLGQQFAYHETSYFLIRMLQQFCSITLDLKAQPPWAAPPPEWKNGTGTQRTDKIRMKSYLTMSVMGGVWVRMEEANDSGGV